MQDAEVTFIKTGTSMVDTALDYAGITAEVTIMIKTNSKWIDRKQPDSTFGQARKICQI
jgi:alkyl hydroperoxide reductase subunit AhpF